MMNGKNFYITTVLTAGSDWAEALHSLLDRLVWAHPTAVKILLQNGIRLSQVICSTRRVPTTHLRL